MIRKILGVVTGYAIFVISSIALFKISGQNPHGETTTLFKIITAGYGILFSLVAGIAARRIARQPDLTINYILAVVVAGFAVFSLLKADGEHWSQLFAIAVFAPSTILGGVIAKKAGTP